MHHDTSDAIAWLWFQHQPTYSTRTTDSMLRSSMASSTDIMSSGVMPGMLANASAAVTTRRIAIIFDLSSLFGAQEAGTSKITTPPPALLTPGNSPVHEV